MELKPCPFCGGEPFFDSQYTRGGHYEYFCHCTSCGATGPRQLNRGRATAEWNIGWNKKRRKVHPADVITATFDRGAIHTCGECFTLLEQVRPGQWQCSVCE